MSLASPIILYIGIAAAFLSALTFAVLLLPSRAGRNVRVLEGAMGPYTRRVSVVRMGTRPLAALAGQIGRLFHKEPKPDEADQDRDMAMRLELAGWPVRPSEFLAIRGSGAAVAALIGFGLTQTWLVALVFAGIAWAAPTILLSRKIDQRTEDFLVQLPDTLHLLAASLEAGHSLLQGLDAVVSESPPPTSTEFARAIAEIRLGMPVGDALESMADRVGGEQFRWAVLAMNVQREVGGNLAAILKTIGETLREREQLRRQVKVLSAEGRISAIVLTGLPLVLGLYMAVFNPSYVSALFGTSVGRMLLLVSAILLGTGGLWMRKLIRIEV